MRYLRTVLCTVALLLWSVAVMGDYNPSNPPEPGVNYTLTTSCVPADGGSCTPSAGSHVYAFGTGVKMGVSANTGFRFAGWEDEEGNVISTTGSFTFTMPPADRHLTAHFVYDPGSPAEPSEPKPSTRSHLTVSCAPADGGSVNYTSVENEVGTTISLHASAGTGFVFDNWTKAGEVVSTSTPFNYILERNDPHLVANFRYSPSSPTEPGEPHISRYLNLKSNMEEAGSLSGSGWHTEGTTFTVSASVNTYYTFVNWTDEEGAEVSTSRSFTYRMPDRNVTLTANYTYDYNPTNPGEPGEPDIPTVAPNMVIRPRIGMYDDTHVMIMCETPGAELHYTLDGTTPTRNSPRYQSPVFVPSNLTVKAIGYVDGMYDSPTATYRVTAYHAGEPSSPSRTTRSSSARPIPKR